MSESLVGFGHLVRVVLLADCVAFAVLGGKPIKQLRAYKRVDVKAGQTVNATITINDKSLEWFDEGTNTIHTKEGSYELVYGNSSDATKAIGIKVE